MCEQHGAAEAPVGDPTGCGAVHASRPDSLSWGSRAGARGSRAGRVRAGLGRTA